MLHVAGHHSNAGGTVGLRAYILFICLVLLASAVVPHRAEGQTTATDTLSLLDRYQVARQRLMVRRQLMRQGGISVFPIEALPTPTDSLRPPPTPDPTTARPEPSFPLDDVRPVRRLERGWFRERFEGVQWSFLGSSPEHTFFDTTRTRELRARLQAEFGDPTQTLADRKEPVDTSAADRAQFEYWFVVNDSIPVRVTDARGPRGRGLIIAAQRRYRDQLRVLRDTLLAPVRRAERAPYVDYYYEGRRDRWYRTGYDGASYFLERIPRSEVIPGRRPRLDTTRTSRTDAPAGASGSS